MNLPLNKKIVPQLQTITRAALTAPVHRALHSDTLEVLNWQSHHFGGGFGNPVSLGLYRVTGATQDQGETVPCSLVLKMAQGGVPCVQPHTPWRRAPFSPSS